MEQGKTGYTTAILLTKVICKQPGRYIGWPSIAKTRAGELLAVFSGDRDEHICPWGKTQMVRSLDKGTTWTEPETVNNFPLDDRDAGIIISSQGTWLVSWFTSLMFTESWLPPAMRESWARHIQKLGPEVRQAWLGNWVRRSVDGGQSWGDPIGTLVSAPHGPIQLSDGRLLYVGASWHHGEKLLGVEESADDGRTWSLIALAPIPEEESIEDYHEPHVTETLNGALVAMFRYEPPDAACYLRQAESADGGRTWSTARPTPIWGFPPHLITLNNGWLLISYGHRRPPFGERACISRDGGQSWDIEAEITLCSAPNGDLGYPASAQLDDGSILTVYYQIDQPGEKTCLMATRWRLEDAD